MSQGPYFIPPQDRDDLRVQAPHSPIGRAIALAWFAFLTGLTVWGVSELVNR